MRKKIKLTELDLHPLHKEIYGTEPIDEKLKESIKKHGVLNDLVITPGKLIISGRRRYLHCLSLGDEGPKEVNCEIRDFEDDLDLVEKLIEYNRYRKKTDEQLAMEGKVLEEIHAKQAENRMKAGKKQDIDSNDHDNPVPKLAQGRSIEKTAKELGIGKESYRKLKKLREASESDDSVISEVAGRLLKDQMSKNKKYNLFRDFEKIYKAAIEINPKNPAIRDYAHGLITDITDGLVKIEDAYQELLNYVVALKKKEKALKDTYPSDDYQTTGEYISDEVIETPEKVNALLNTLKTAKPADDTSKPIFDKKPVRSSKYQTLLKAKKDANIEIAHVAAVLLENVDNDELTTDDAVERLESKISEIEDRESLENVPDEPGEIIEKPMEPVDPEVLKEHLKDCDHNCEACQLQDQFKFCNPEDGSLESNNEIENINFKEGHEYRPEELKTCNLCGWFHCAYNKEGKGVAESCHRGNEHPRMKSMESIPTNDFCKRCKEGPIVGSGINADIKILMRASLEAAKYNHKWNMDNHVLLNKVLVELQSSSK